MALTPEQEQEILTKVARLHDHIVGYDEVKGLSEKFDEQTEKNNEEHAEIRKNHSNLKRKFWMLVAFLVGSGVISASVLSAMG